MSGVISRGIRAPIIREGDDIVKLTADSVCAAMEKDGFELHDRDVVAVTESIVARADGNYATADDIAEDVRNKTGGGTVGLVFPILSRNRFAICLRGIARGCSRIVLMLSYPSDEVGNHLFDEETLFSSGVNPYRDTLSLDDYRRLFGYAKHTFTGVDYVERYREIIAEENCEAEIIFSNRPEEIVSRAESVICCDIHTRERTKQRVEEAGASKVLTLCDILSAPVNGSGYNPKYGLLGSNKATDEKIKLFPKNAQEVAEKLSGEFYRRTGAAVECMVYGDGAFKDPVGKIWELADPVVSPGYTRGLEGLPSEVKLKYLADNQFSGLEGEELRDAITRTIRDKSGDLKGKMASEGTTPRRLTDLLGSLCDLTSGSGDKGTPIIVVQNYFKNYAED